MSNEKKSVQVEPMELHNSPISTKLKKKILFEIPYIVTRTAAQLRSLSQPSLYNRHCNNRLDSENRLISKVQCEPQEMELQMKNSH